LNSTCINKLNMKSFNDLVSSLTESLDAMGLTAGMTSTLTATASIPVDKFRLGEDTLTVTNDTNNAHSNSNNNNNNNNSLSSEKYSCCTADACLSSGRVTIENDYITVQQDHRTRSELLATNDDIAGTLLTDDGLPIYGLSEVSTHCTPDDAWTVIYDKVYDVTEYLARHPGGEEVLMEYVGYDATIAFRGVGHSKAAFRILEKYLIGILPAEERLGYDSDSY